MRGAYAAHSDESTPNPFRCGGGCGSTDPRERQETIVEDLGANTTEIGAPEEPLDTHTTTLHVLVPNVGLAEPKNATAIT